jgi:hypothetical protein
VFRCFRIVNDSMASKIYSRIVALGSHIRPNTFILPNYPSYDDMPRPAPPTGLWSYGEWVNGGVWTTCEARAIMAYYRVNATEDAFRSTQYLIERFGRSWRMDNPLPDFGREVYQPNDPINLTVDAFGAPAAFIRGLFEYLYAAATLTILPHLPCTLMSLTQQFPIRWGEWSYFLCCLVQTYVAAHLPARQYACMDAAMM